MFTPWRSQGRGVPTPFILKSGVSWTWMVSLTPRPLYSGWVSETVWTLGRGENPLPLKWIEPRFLGRAAHDLITIPTTLSRFIDIFYRRYKTGLSFRHIFCILYFVNYLQYIKMCSIQGPRSLAIFSLKYFFPESSLKFLLRFIFNWH
jgi:hypothetical protein